MNPKIDRIEIYLDDATEPTQVLTEPPFKVELDTRNLRDGDHVMRIVTYFKNGQTEERIVPFVVDNLPDVAIEGLSEGEEVRGKLEFDVKVGDYHAPIERARVSPMLYLLSTVLILGGIWAWFAFGSFSSTIVSEVAGSAEAAQEETVGEGAPVDEALFAQGETIYASSCAACHGAEGVGGFAPQFAGNPALADTEAVLKTIYEGRGGMPAFNQFSAEELAAIATYIRNAWGNTYGGVSVDEAKGVTGGTPEELPPSEDGAAAPEEDTGNLEALLKEGSEVYAASCAGCHQAEGQGIPGTFPPLAENPNLEDAAYVVKVILNGRQGPLEVKGTTYNGAMPGFGQLSDRQVAAVATYVRNSWGNAFGPVSEEQVAQER
ncbi:c-type cytochrome [Marinithermus hydrothermalis]|uniref:Cytochrome c class I n=1 Tax=Marinithermus hydrothermalis (strain DSM 14884 / JCM 11576 / T1) TaxID=869210 RepID=F2NR50_MARHT|nr:c-type cytochrome [Marinithermus hydrothermalis]AEB12899.1 cytochrome c class I [Marinithermus hydrothermalis DSM 14884]